MKPLGHGSDCALCAAVDSWAANRKRRPTPRSGQNDLAGGVGASLRSRDDSARSGSPDLRASAVPITADGGAPRFGPAGLIGTADVQRQGASTRSSATG